MGKKPELPNMLDIGSIIPEDRMPKFPDLPDIGSIIPEDKMPTEPPKIRLLDDNNTFAE